MAGKGGILRENGKKGKKFNAFLGKMTKKGNPPPKDRCGGKASVFQRMSAFDEQNVKYSFQNCKFSVIARFLSVDNTTCKMRRNCVK